MIFNDHSVKFFDYSYTLFVYVKNTISEKTIFQNTLKIQVYVCDETEVSGTGH